MKKFMLGFLVLPFCVSSFIVGCSKNSTNTKDSDASSTKQDQSNKFSLKITTNIPEAKNYSVNVSDLNSIEKDTEITISNTSGFYIIKQFLSSNNDLLSTGDSYTFKITQDTEIKIMFTYSNKYYFSNRDDNGKANIILMSGQSNMAGSDTKFSLLNNDTIQYYNIGHDNVAINYHANANYTFNNEDSADFTYVNFGQGNSLQTFGPEMGLAKSLGKYKSNETYYLIKVAYGGTSLFNNWNVDNIENTANKMMYGRFVKYLSNCLTMFKNQTNLTPNIKAMLWLQGESDTDTDSGVHAVEYATHFQKLVNDVKSRYADYLSSDFKWISALISKTYRDNQGGATVENIEYVNSALKKYSDRIVTETEYDLPKINNLHYTPESSLKIGEYFYRELFR